MCSQSSLSAVFTDMCLMYDGRTPVGQGKFQNLWQTDHFQIEISRLEFVTVLPEGLV